MTTTIIATVAITLFVAFVFVMLTVLSIAVVILSKKEIQRYRQNLQTAFIESNKMSAQSGFVGGLMIAGVAAAGLFGIFLDAQDKKQSLEQQVSEAATKGQVQFASLIEKIDVGSKVLKAIEMAIKETSTQSTQAESTTTETK